MVQKTLLVCITVMCCIITSVTVVGLFTTKIYLEGIDKRTDATYFLLKAVSAKCDSILIHQPQPKKKK